MDAQKYNEIEAYKEKSKSGYKGAHLLEEYLNYFFSMNKYYHH